MSNEISKHFKNIKIPIDKNIIYSIIKLVRSFEVRGEHPYTLNSPLIGCYDFKFTYEDRKLFFDLFEIEEDEIRDIIKNIHTIPKEFKVVSDPFNMFTSYVIHSFLTDKRINKNQQEECIFHIANYFQYKLFGSLISHYFPHKTNQDYMTAVMEDLSYKYDIKSEGTWKQVIYNRTKSMILDNNAIHKKTLTKFEPDKDVMYFISDLQTRIRNQIKLIANLYYDYREKRIKIESMSSTVEIDGEKIIKEPEVTFEAMSYVILNHIKYGSINQKYLSLVTALYKTLNKTLITRTLNLIHNIYLEQLKHNLLEKSIIPKDKNLPYNEIYYGLKLFVNKLIEFSNNYLIKNNVNLKRKINIITTLYKTFSSSRLLDQTFINLKFSLRKIIVDNKITRRESTLSSLIPCIELYLMLIGLDALNHH